MTTFNESSPSSLRQSCRKPGEDSPELQALKRFDETSTKLQKQGSYLEALECLERGLVLRQHFFGAKSNQVISACKVIAQMCNLLAMSYLQQSNLDLVLELLKKAEILTERSNPLGRAVTFNNLACYYRRRGKLRAALQYTQKALQIEARLDKGDYKNNGEEDCGDGAGKNSCLTGDLCSGDQYHPADTHLNACAVLSQLGRHQSALEHAQSGLILLQEELFKGFDNSEYFSSRLQHRCQNDDDDEEEVHTNPSDNSKEVPIKLDRIAVLAIAYHNMGVEQEFLKKYDHSVISYQKGMEISKQYLGPDHSTTVTLRNSCLAAEKAIAAKNPRLCALRKPTSESRERRRKVK